MEIIVVGSGMFCADFLNQNGKLDPYADNLTAAKWN